MMRLVFNGMPDSRLADGNRQGSDTLSDPMPDARSGDIAHLFCRGVY